MNKTLITQTATYIRSKLEGEGSGHDWWHIYRVWQLAKRIAQSEPKANQEFVELGALLHDVADWKFHDGDESVGPRIAGEYLASLEVDPSTIQAIQQIIQDVSYKGAGVTTKPRSLEGMIVQDADRLDALGAIGIARCFVYSGHVGRPMWDPNDKPVLHQSAKEYKSNQGSAINHFYEKLLLLKDRMHTKTGRKLAVKRHTYMEKFLTKFYAEWDGRE